MIAPLAQLERPRVRSTSTDRLRPIARKRSKKSAALLLIRRVHLYSGLFLLPWVFIYGVSAALFNHADWMPGRASTSLDADVFAGTALQGPFDAGRSADEVVNALRDHWIDSQLVIGDPQHAALSGVLYYQIEDRATEDPARSPRTHFLRVDLEGRGAKLTSREERTTEAPAHFAVAKGLKLENSPLHTAATELAPLYAGLGISPDAEPARLRNAPELEFDLAVDGEPWRATYDFRRESLSARPAGVTESPTAIRRLLTRLHVMHGYTPWWSAESAWAIFVDGMAAAMLVWGASGVLMWWQMKRLRRAGAITLFVSAATVALVIWPLLD